VAQVGRISGPLLEANLLRQGTTSNPSQANLTFKNTNSDPTLLKINVNDGRIGVDVEAPANELHISNTTQTINLIGDTADIANFSWSTNRIDSNNGPIYLNAGEHIQASNLETEQFYISDNYILTHSTNTDIDLKFNGTGLLDVKSNLEVFGNMHSAGNITFDGNITFGDADTDSVDFNADVKDDIMPDITDTYTIGKKFKRWNEIHTNLVNGQLVTTGVVNVDNMFLDSRQGNIFYVAANGDNTNVGDHPQSPLATIEEALARCDASTLGPVTVLVYPGVYEETCPLVVPERVTVRGVDLRNTVVKPTVATQDKDIFHLNDSSTLSDITIKDYYYNSINNTGYALRFAPNAVITNRSPYAQNITVITKGSVTSASDPRGFDEGDAGRGAWIDGAELDSSSIEASMLFHSCTFICPNADVISMTNGVRVEWLNSFTYFANRGLYAFNGVTGRTTYDGSTVEYGAEVRSIGSANVYGNYGAVADGADTLMYLIQHNMAYIGAGKYVDNDKSRAIYANEIEELNSGKIHFTTTDHLGGFRIGDNFWVDFETGNTTINIDTLSVNQFNALRVNTGANTTVIDGAFIDLGNFTISNNVIESRTGDINIASATGQINLQNNTNVTGDVNITGDLTFDGTLNFYGDQATDRLEFNTEFEQNFNPHQTLTFDLGSFEKRWLLAHLDRVEGADFSIYDNVIELNVSNADFELRANGTGEIYIPESVQVNNNLTVSGTTTINSDVDITDPNFIYVGDINQTGNFTVSGNADISQNLTVGASVQFEEILINDNTITTTTSNADLELRAVGTGTVNLQETVNVTNNLSARDTSATNTTVNLNITTDNANIGNVEINDNYIETTSLNGDLNLGADRNVIITGTDTLLQQDLTVQGYTSLQGTSITGNVTHVGDTNQTGNVTLLGEWTNSNIYIEDNFITTTESNSNLELRASGTGEVTIPNNDVQINNDLTVSTDTNLQGTTITGTIIHTGDRTQVGSFQQSGELTVDNVYIEDNFITTTSGNLILESAGTGTINVDSNDVEIAQDLTVSGATSLQGTTITGTVTHVGDLQQTGNFDIAGEISNGNILIEDNFITTTNSNSDLELRASGTGEVIIDTGNVLTINNNFFVGGTMEYTGALTINGNVVLAKSIQDGSLTVTDNLFIDGTLDVSQQAQFEEILIDDNFITTTTSNADLELRASGTGKVLVPNNNMQVDNDLSTRYISAVDINVTNNLNLYEINVTDGNIEIRDNYVTTNVSNSNLELRASGSGDVYMPENVQIDNNLTVSGTTNLQNTTVTGTITHAGDTNITSGTTTVLTGFIVDIGVTSWVVDIGTNSNTLLYNGVSVGTFTGTQSTFLSGNDTYNRGSLVDINGNVYTYQIEKVGDTRPTSTISEYTQVGNLDVTGQVDFQGDVQLTDIRISDNVITTTVNNNDLDLRAVGTGKVLIDGTNLRVNNNLFTASITTTDINVAQDLVLDEINITDSNIEINENYISTSISNSNLELRASGTGEVYIPSNDVTIEQDLTVNSNTNIDNASITGDLILTGTRTQTGNYNLIGNLNISSLVTDQAFQFDDIKIHGNVLETTLSNSNLDLRAAGTGQIIFNENLHVYKDLTTSTFNVNSISVDDNVDLDTIELSTDIQFFDNVITTTNSNSNLELRTNGTGSVYLQEIEFTGNTIGTTSPIDSTVRDITLAPTENLIIDSTSALQIPKGLTSQRVESQDIFLDGGLSTISGSILDGGSASTIFGSSDTIYNSGGSVLVSSGNIGDIRFNIDDHIFEGTGSTSTITFNGVYSANRQTSVTADPTSNNIRFIVNGAENPLDSTNLAGEVTGEGLFIHGIQVDDVLFDNNTIETNVTNSDLELSANGTGETSFGNISIKDNSIKDNGNNLILKTKGFGHIKFNGSKGIVVPTGLTGERPANLGQPNPQIGDTRWNTSNQVLETWNGTEYIASAGIATAITPAEFDDLLLEYTLIFG